MLKFLTFCGVLYLVIVLTPFVNIILPIIDNLVEKRHQYITKKTECKKELPKYPEHWWQR